MTDIVHKDHLTEQTNIIRTLGAKPEIEPASEFIRRADFLRALLIETKRKCFVLGISGGVDSLVAGLIAQRAVVQAREERYQAKFVAMRLPYGDQRDEADAQRALKFIQPDEVLTVNIKKPSDEMLLSLKHGGTFFDTAGQEDFVHGNIKARQRMIAQYAVAGREEGLVIGTDHAAEALMGFFTKHGDGACDVTPLAGLNKRQVRAIARSCGAEETLAMKVPTADLESLVPMKPDELAFGISYHEIDDFLEGKQVSSQAYDVIIRQYRATAHKRRLPITLPGL
ncbi:NH(3)-dependent NAD(+) synthetase [Oxalicibacterium faecigallinarum]|uniref:NH(3)-dependent NAD(+) synthetase n=1 Tax=Oxalicibacterium faecigallinarum TaxID=573741 RepID=A0A8J3F2G2_9BURK|nr:ammonia-dependent NAD(+) synthetase [Oxalicibacterium faecigallinarum]GGI18352.1 NH(3)-dependent NAD(+) synthetase [Oxalicibacterium faecigallinarum]